MTTHPMTTSGPAGPCPCCQAAAFRVRHGKIRSIYSETPYAIWACTQCGHGVTQPVPDPKKLSEIYALTYLYPVHLAVRSEKQYRARKLAKWIVKNLQPKGPWRALDVGCMHGFLVEALQQHGADAYGVEIGREPVEYCRARGLKVEEKAVEDMRPGEGEPYDLIVMTHVLEHVVDPLATLEKLRRMLKPGGHLVIGLPNNASCTARLFGRFWGWWQVPIHLNHFSPRSLVSMMQRAGFEPASRKTAGGDSLLLLLNFMNMLGRGGGGGKKTLSRAGAIFLNVHCRIFRYWYRLGGEELIVAGRNPESRP